MAGSRALRIGLVVAVLLVVVAGAAMAVFGWGDARYLDRAAELRTPVLLFHGAEDGIVPVGKSDRLAALRPDIVRYERFDGAHHVRSWNVDPARYEVAVRAFLTGVAPER